MTCWADRTLVEDVVAMGVDDWVYAAEVYGIASRSGLVGENLRFLSVGLIVEVLSRGLAVPGDYDGEQHRPWECSTEAAILRIVNDWRGWGGEAPTPGAIVWLELTESGRALGEAILEREGQQQ